jgi:hypothetical protein
MTLEDAERRQQARIEFIRPCKVYDPRSRRYVAGSTWNVSSTGMLVELARPLPLAADDQLFVGVATRRRDAVLCRNEMIPARVARSVLTADDHTVVALELAYPLEIPDQMVVERIAA